jgi:hypothetical protein
MATMTRRSLLKLGAAAGAATGLALPATARAAQTKNLLLVGKHGNLNLVTPSGGLIMYYHNDWANGSSSWYGPYHRGDGFDRFGWMASCGIGYTYDNLYIGVDGSGVYGYYWRNVSQAWAYDGLPARIAGLTDLGWGNLRDVISGGYVTHTTGTPGSTFYTIDGYGQLRWHMYLGVPGEGGRWAVHSGNQIGTDWDAFRYVTAGPDGVLYGIDSSGAMRWYRYLWPHYGGNQGWHANSGAVVGQGWYGGTYGYQTVQSAGVGAGDRFRDTGGLYMVDRDGNLRWNKHLGWADGTPSWQLPTGGGRVIGTGWM